MKGSSKGWCSIPAPTNAGCLSDLPTQQSSLTSEKKRVEPSTGLKQQLWELGRKNQPGREKGPISSSPHPFPLSLLPPSSSLPLVLPPTSFSLSLSPTLPFTLHLQLISFLCCLCWSEQTEDGGVGIWGVMQLGKVNLLKPG